MKLFLIFSILLYSTALRSAEAISPWSDYWKILVTGEGCSLEREFSSKRAKEANMIVGADYEIFDQFNLWFYIPSFTKEKFAGIEYIKNELHFSVLSQVYPKVSEEQQRIESVRINGIEIPRPNKSETTSYRQFFVYGQAAHDILRLFQSEERITIDLGLSGGEIESLGIPSSSKQRFRIWSKLLFVCANEMAPSPQQGELNDR